MKKNGFLLNELLISFAISAIIMLSIFSATLILNRRLSDLYVENKNSTQQIILNRKVAYNFSNVELNKIEKVNNKLYNLTFSDREMSIEININENYIVINSADNQEKFDIENDSKIDLTNIDGIFKCKPLNDGSGKNLVSIKIPIKYPDSDKDFGIEQYNITSTACGTNGLPTS